MLATLIKALSVIMVAVLVKRGLMPKKPTSRPDRRPEDHWARRGYRAP